MTNQKFDTIVQNELREDEAVLWMEQAVHFGLLEGKDGTKVRNKMIGAVAGVGVFLGLYVAIVPEVNMGLILVSLGLLALMLLTPVLACRTLNDRSYVITDRRVLVFKGDWMQAEMDLENVDAVSRYSLKNGAESLALGGKIQEEGDRQLRWRSTHPYGGEHGNYTGMVLYGVPHAAKAEAILLSRTPVRKAA